MKSITVEINGVRVEKSVEPRTQLVDFLREEVGLTGTHVGCEHGICGACTVEIDGQTARSCITLAVCADGCRVNTIEAFDDDPVMAQLRTAFSEEHALQCGYCTPGMLIAARDLVRRGSAITPDEIRVEMSGNLCRCTGYTGIVKAISRVVAGAEMPPAVSADTRLGPAPGPGAMMMSSAATASVGSSHSPTDRTSRHLNCGSRSDSPERVDQPSVEITIGDFVERDGMTWLTQRFALPHGIERVWPMMSDMSAVATCMPGVELDGPLQDSHVAGQIAVGLGPISARFKGDAVVEMSNEAHSVNLSGQGRDTKSASRARGTIAYHLTKLDKDRTQVDVEIGYALSGPLAQFSRPGLVRDVVSRLSSSFAANIDARLSGVSITTSQNTRISLFSLLWGIIRNRFARLVSRRDSRHDT